jgi:hypothetical protein
MHKLFSKTFQIILLYVIVVMIAIVPKARGFKPGRGRRILRVIKIHSTTSFRGEVKPSAPCRLMLWHEKEPCGI